MNSLFLSLFTKSHHLPPYTLKNVQTRSNHSINPNIQTTMPNYAQNASNTGSWRSFGSRRKRDVASNYPLDASFLIMDDDDEGYSFPIGIFSSSATARVKALFSPSSRRSKSPLSSQATSANTSPLTPTPSARSSTKGFKAKVANACRFFKPSGYSVMKEDKKLQRVIRYEAPCPIAEAKEERKWRALAEERQKQVDAIKKEAKKRKALEKKKRFVIESGPYAGWVVDKTTEAHGPGDLPPMWAGMGYYHDGARVRQCRLSQIGADAEE
jgi:hypothetical protein